jgi:hypothetical protein
MKRECKMSCYQFGVYYISVVSIMGERERERERERELETKFLGSDKWF